MHFIRDGRLRRLGLLIGAGLLAALAITGATSARVDAGDSGSSAVVLTTNDNDKVTLCHAAGQAGTTHFVTLTISYNAAFGQAGHFYEDGTPQAGHEDDYLGPCNPPPTDDVCPNIEGDQAEIPAGMVKDEEGNCVTPTPPTDVCPNIEGNQAEIPAGMVKDDEGDCVTPTPPTDVCPNIEGNQAEIPAGMVKDGQGNCVTPPTPPTDVCPNIQGNQAEIPDGMVKDGQGNCVTPPTPPTDVCPNIQGNQAEIPAGMVKDGQGNCVTPSTPSTPTTPTTPATVQSDEFMDVQVSKAATPQVQLVNGQADIAYTLSVRNNGPNQAHSVTLVDAAPSGVTFLAITQQPLVGSCTLTSALLSCSLGTLGPGVERTVGLSARVTQTGTYVNSATATGDGKDTNGQNNTGQASTLVTAPVTPPTTTPKPPVKPKPASKPKPQVNICRVLKVTPGMVKANGNRQLVVAKVTHSRNPVQGVAVRFSGNGLSKVVKTNAQGVARFSIAPRKAGIMLVRITSAKACNTARVGVIGAFEPPVTG